MMDNKEKIATKNNKTPRKKEMQKEWVYKLDDSYFKEFFLKYSRERKYLFTKVDNNMLAEFAAMEFSLKDILTCKYIELYKKAKGINEETFRKEVLKYMTINDSESEKDETENRESHITDIEKTELERKKFKKIKKDAIYYIEDNIGDKTAGDSKKLLANYDSFEDNQIEYLSKTFDYIFDGNEIMKEFKFNKRQNYKFNSLEAMLIFYIMDDYNEGDYKKIRNKNINSVSRTFMKSIKRYVIAIEKYRKLKGDCSELRKVYKKRIVETKSDLPGIYYSLNKLEKELTKKDAINFENLEEEIKTCRKKLKKLLKSIRKKAKKASKKNKESTQS